MTPPIYTRRPNERLHAIDLQPPNPTQRVAMHLQLAASPHHEAASKATSHPPTISHGVCTRGAPPRSIHTRAAMAAVPSNARRPLALRRLLHEISPTASRPRQPMRPPARSSPTTHVYVFRQGDFSRAAPLFAFHLLLSLFSDQILRRWSVQRGVCFALARRSGPTAHRKFPPLATHESARCGLALATLRSTYRECSVCV